MASRSVALLLALAGASMPVVMPVHAARAPATTRRISAVEAVRSRPDDGFGSAIDISGSIAIVGAPGARKSSGAAYIFERSGRSWRLRATLFNPTRSPDQFGNAVAVSGTTVAIGAWAARGGRGYVYLYARANNRWHRIARFSPAVPAPCDTCGQGDFGNAVAISNSVMVASAYLVGDFSGAVFIYTHWRNGSWHLQARLTYPRAGPPPPVEFGSAVAVQRTTVVIGALEAGNNRGKVFIYSRGPHSWSRQATLTGATDGELLGANVAISGASIAAGGFSTGRNAARGYIFTEHNGHWRQTGYMTTPAGQPNQGGYYTSVGISGVRAIIGDPKPNPHQCGAAYEYEFTGATWRKRAKIVNPGCAPNDFFGAAVALSGSTMVIGAPGYHQDAGTAYVQGLP